MVRASSKHLPNSSCGTVLFLPHFDVICDLLLNSSTTTWNRFFQQMLETKDADYLNGKNNFHQGVIKIIYQENCNAESEKFRANRLAKKTTV